MCVDYNVRCSQLDVLTRVMVYGITGTPTILEVPKYADAVGGKV